MRNKLWLFTCVDKSLHTGFHYGFYVVAPDSIEATNKLNNSNVLTADGKQLEVVQIELKDSIRGLLVE